MFLASLVVAGSTLKLLAAQEKLLDETMREANAQALTLLSSRVERALLGELRLPFLTLKSTGSRSADNARLRLAAKWFPDVQHILLVDGRLRPLATWSKGSAKGQRGLDQWLANRVGGEIAVAPDKPYGVHTFVERLSGGPALIALQLADELDPGAGWIVMRFDLDALTRRVIDPLLQEFLREHDGKILLEDPEAPWDDQASHVPLTPVLPGWLLSYWPDPSRQRSALIRAQLPLVGVGVGALIALGLATFAAWRELRHEKSLAELRNRFVANVSHELRTPLTLIRLYAETLYLDRITDGSRRRAYYETIMREAERLTAMIDSVLDLERLRRGQALYRLTATDLRATVDQALERYRDTLTQRGAQLEVDLAEGLAPVAHDPQGVTQILLNLLTNALDHGGQGPLALSLAQEGAWVDLSVTDQGPGLSGEELAAIRRALQRGEAVASRRGSGLGLALVERIAVAHRAYLVLDTPETGTGLRAVVSFPVKRQDPPST
jgi:signal transduction histidine kinase